MRYPQTAAVRTSDSLPKGYNDAQSDPPTGSTHFGVEVAKAGAALLLLYIGGIWLSSGIHAQ